MRKCCVPGCFSNRGQPYIPTFLFPRDSARRKLWEQKVGSPGIKVNSNIGVCIKHFEDKYIIRQEKFLNDNNEIVLHARKKITLSNGAFPTIFPTNDIETSPSSEILDVKRSPKSSGVQTKSSKGKKSAVSSNFNSANAKMIKNANKQSSVHQNSLQKSNTTNRPIITIIKAEEASNSVQFDVKSEPDIEILDIEQIDAVDADESNSLSFSFSMKEEDRTASFKDKIRSKRRSSSICSNSSDGSNDACKSPVSLLKRRRTDKPIVTGRQNDCYCWVCHKEGIILCCIVCPRAYHQKCAGEQDYASEWVCTECRRIMTAENVDTRSPALKDISLDKFCALLKCSLNKLRCRSPIAFHQPVPVDYYSSYLDYVINPVDLSLIEKNIKQKMYGCTESFLADIKWIQHNSCIFNGAQHPLTAKARSLVKICEYDMGEIEICPECFLHACTRSKYWFADVCHKPHPLVWAKLKGFPYWPAKVVKIAGDNVDARFFGAHDRAWVPMSQCYHLSKEMPTSSKPKKKSTYETALDELNVHVQLLMQTFGKFEYAPYRTPFDRNNQLFLYHGIEIQKITSKDSLSRPVFIPENKKLLTSTPKASEPQVTKGEDEKLIDKVGMENNNLYEQNNNRCIAESKLADSIVEVLNKNEENRCTEAVNKEVKVESEEVIENYNKETDENSVDVLEPDIKKIKLEIEQKMDWNFNEVKSKVNTKVVPSGVFEVSKNIKLDQPINLESCSSELPALNLNNKNDKLETALKRIEEIVSDKSHEQEDAVISEHENKQKTDINLLSVENIDENRKGTSNSDCSGGENAIKTKNDCSAKKTEPDISDISSQNKNNQTNENKLSNILTDSKDSIVNEEKSSVTVQKSSDNLPAEQKETEALTTLISASTKFNSFALKLDETIESCKAKLGITEITDNHYSSDESDEEEEEEDDGDEVNENEKEHSTKNCNGVSSNEESDNSLDSSSSEEEEEEEDEEVEEVEKEEEEEEEVKKEEEEQEVEEVKMEEKEEKLEQKNEEVQVMEENEREDEISVVKEKEGIKIVEKEKNEIRKVEQVKTKEEKEEEEVMEVEKEENIELGNNKEREEETEVVEMEKEEEEEELEEGEIREEVEKGEAREEEEQLEKEKGKEEVKGENEGREVDVEEKEAEEMKKQSKCGAKLEDEEVGNEGKSRKHNDDLSCFENDIEIIEVDSKTSVELGAAESTQKQFMKSELSEVITDSTLRVDAAGNVMRENAVEKQKNVSENIVCQNKEFDIIDISSDSDSQESKSEVYDNLKNVKNFIEESEKTSLHRNQSMTFESKQNSFSSFNNSCSHDNQNSKEENSTFDDIASAMEIDELYEIAKKNKCTLPDDCENKNAFLESPSKKEGNIGGDKYSDYSQDVVMIDIADSPASENCETSVSSVADVSQKELASCKQSEIINDVSHDKPESLNASFSSSEDQMNNVNNCGKNTVSESSAVVNNALNFENAKNSLLKTASIDANCMKEQMDREVPECLNKNISVGGGDDGVSIKNIPLRLENVFKNITSTKSSGIQSDNTCEDVAEKSKSCVSLQFRKEISSREAVTDDNLVSKSNSAFESSEFVPAISSEKVGNVNRDQSSINISHELSVVKQEGDVEVRPIESDTNDVKEMDEFKEESIVNLDFAQMKRKLEETENQLKAMHFKLEKQEWYHAQEKLEMHHNLNLMLMEMRSSLEAYKREAIDILSKQHNTEKELAIAETKRKQWCANCMQEAIFHCCWNTSYCSHSCQKHDWPKHRHSCTQMKLSSPVKAANINKPVIDMSMVQNFDPTQKKIMLVNPKLPLPLVATKTSTVLNAPVMSLATTVPSVSVENIAPAPQPLVSVPKIQVVTTKSPFQIMPSAPSVSLPFVQSTPLQVPIGYGIEVKAKSLERCLNYGTSAAKLTRCLMDVLFPNIQILASSCAFGRKSNVTKKMRPALPPKAVSAIIDFVTKKFPGATRSEVVSTMNLKCKEARKARCVRVRKSDLKVIQNHRPKNILPKITVKDPQMQMQTLNSDPVSQNNLPSTSMDPGLSGTALKTEANINTPCVKISAAAVLPQGSRTTVNAVTVSSAIHIVPTNKTIVTPSGATGRLVGVPRILKCSPNSKPHFLIKPKPNILTASKANTTVLHASPNSMQIVSSAPGKQGTVISLVDSKTNLQALLCSTTNSTNVKQLNVLPNSNLCMQTSSISQPVVSHESDTKVETLQQPFIILEPPTSQ